MGLSKILPVFLSPIVLVVGLMLVSLIWRRRSPGVLAVLLLLTASTPFLAERLLDATQGGARQPEPATLPRREAVVVLGGALGYSPGVSRDVADWGVAIDRIFGGIELMLADRGERVIFSSGVDIPAGVPTEGERARTLARGAGIAPERIVLSPRAVNTADEVRLIRALFATESPAIILVTSASHMPRAARIFSAAGFSVTPYPVDTNIRVQRPWYDLWLPSAEALRKSDNAVRELIGQAYYRALYWLT